MKRADRVRFVEHRGKQVLVADFTNSTPEEVRETADEVKRVVTTQSENSVLIMADFEGAQFTKDALASIKEATAYDRPYVKRAAWVHTENLPQVLYEAIKRFSQREFPTFETREQALDFLVQD